MDDSDACEPPPAPLAAAAAAAADAAGDTGSSGRRDERGGKVSLKRLAACWRWARREQWAREADTRDAEAETRRALALRLAGGADLLLASR